MKRFLSILLLLALLPLCFAACQRTPDEVIVVQKDTERLVEQARAHDGAADAGQALSARLGTPERYRADYAYADAFSMTADAAVVLPEADRLPTARVIPADFSQEREYSICHDYSIEVIDHGKGIPKEEIPRITEPFYMVDRSRSKLIGGSGLGMALVKKIAEAHGAKLVIESAENRGTTIRLIFTE